MNKTTILTLVAFIAVGFIGYGYKDTILNSIQPLSNMAQPIVNSLQSGFTQVQATWATLPEPVKQYAIPGILGVFSVFLMWTKTRAVQALQQTKVQASEQLGQLQGETSEKISQLAKDKQVLTERLASMPQTDPQLSSLLSESQKLVTQQGKQIEKLTNEKHEVERMMRVFTAPTEEDMIKKLAVQGYNITKKIA